MARPAGARASGASRDPALWVTVAVLWALLALFVLYPLLCLLARVAMDGERLSPGARGPARRGIARASGVTP